MPAWRRIDTWDAPPGFCMALDEALLVADGAPPTLRLYTWQPAALSLGYFQRYADVPAARVADVVVRRITGGGAIHHAGELTFSITAPLEHPLYRGPVRASYERVHALLARVLADAGVEASLCGARAADSDRDATGMCFHESTPLDLVWGGRKGVGSAQRRSGGRVLHHGSIKLQASALEPGVATVTADARELGDRLADALARETGAALERAEPTEEELLFAYRRESWFTGDEHVRRR